MSFIILWTYSDSPWVDMGIYRNGKLGMNCSLTDVYFLIPGRGPRQFLGKVEFFSSEGSDTSISIPVVPLRGWTIFYPPRRSLSWCSSTCMTTTWTNTNGLWEQMMMFTSKETVWRVFWGVWIVVNPLSGQTGLGTTEEMGKLALEPGENLHGGPWCDHEPGSSPSENGPTHRQVPPGNVYTPRGRWGGKVRPVVCGVQCVWSAEGGEQEENLLIFVMALISHRKLW